MIYTDNAVEFLRNALTPHTDLEFKVGKCNEKYAEYLVTKCNVTIEVWFDVTKQLFGFTMIQGGCKTYDNVVDCINYLVIYLNLFSEFIPKCKCIADEFEKELGINTIYDNFVGNEEKGYIAVFRMLGVSDRAVHIKKDSEGTYTAKLVILSEDKTKFKCEIQRTYSIDNSNNVILILTLDFYLEKLYDLFEDDDAIVINRLAIDNFVFKIGSFKISTKVKIVENRIVYDIYDLNGIAVSRIIDIDNPFDMNMIYIECKQLYEDSIKPSDDFIMPDTVEPEIYPVNESALDNFNEPVKEVVQESVHDIVQELVQEPVAEVISEPIQEPMIDVTIQEPVTDVIEESIKEQVVTESTNLEQGVDIMNIAMYRVLNQNSVVSVQIIMDNNIYGMSLVKAEALGIPVDRIVAETKLLTNRVIAISEVEKEHKMFAKDISDNDVLCSQVLTLLFE